MAGEQPHAADDHVDVLHHERAADLRGRGAGGGRLEEGKRRATGKRRRGNKGRGKMRG